MPKLHHFFERHTFIAALIGILIGSAFTLFVVMYDRLLPPTIPIGTAAAVISSPYIYSFNVGGVLNEADSMEHSSSPYWWLNSGGLLTIHGGVGETVQGSLSTLDRWRLMYAKNNPVDTDNGYHPQNLFRLVSRSTWNNVSAEARYMIVHDNFSASPNHNASNGLLLMTRYKSGQTLYYAGIRVDGMAVIKKKYEGTYYTMAEEKVFPGTYQGSREDINLIPHNVWISLRSLTTTGLDGSVTVNLYMQEENQDDWTLLLSAKDTGQYGNTPPIIGAGYVGIRTDFMDVKFDSMRMEEIQR
jgi:hypothetical protein